MNRKTGSGRIRGWAMFRIAAASLCAAMILIVAVPVSADETPNRSVSVIRSGAETDYPPFSFVDAHGKADGFSVELMRAALAAMGRTVTFRTGPWSDVRGWLERAEIDALPLVGRTPEREALFDFTVPYMSLHGAIVVRKNQTGIRSLEDLRGRTAAVMKGDNAEEFLRREERGIEIKTCPTFKIALQELSRGRYDAVVVQRLVALRLIRKTGLTGLRVLDRPIEGFEQDFCFAVHERDRETLALLNEGLAVVVADGTYRHLHSKWFAAMQLPSDRPVIVGGDQNFPPFEFLDENGQPAGFHVDLTRAVAREMDLNIVIRLGPLAEMRRALETGKIDIIQGMSYSPARNLKFDFSPPHTACHYIAVVRKGQGPAPASVEALSGRRIVVERGDIPHDFAIANGLETLVTAVADQETALLELSRGKHDCALVSRTAALFLMDKHGWQNLVPGKKMILPSEHAYAAAKGQRAMLTLFSEGLKVLENSGEYRQIHDKWLGVYMKDSVTVKKMIGYLIIVAGPLLIFILVIAVWSWALRRQVTEKTRALRESLDRFKHVFEASNVGKSIALPTGEITSNKAFADFLGYTREEIKGKRWQDVTAAQDLAKTEKFITPLLAGEKNAARFEKRYVHKNGQRLWADVNVAVHRDARGKPLYLITTIVDLTDRKQAEEALQSREEHLRAIIACSPVALYTIDVDGTVISWNQQAEKMFGWRAKEIIGKPLPIVPEESRDEFAALRQGAFAGRTFTGKELVRMKKDGTLFPISLSIALVRNDRNDVIGVLSAAEDITERKLTLSRIDHLNRVLRAIRDINQLIVRESDRKALIREGCRLLVANRGYASAMIILTDRDGRPCLWAQDGLGTASDELEGMLKQGEMPDCHLQVRDKENVSILGDREHACTGCPIAVASPGTQMLLSPLVHGGKELGYLSVAAEKHLVVDEEEKSLFKDLAADFAYALNVMKGEEARKKITKEHKKLASQFLQAQKMESVGRLAGGVAHDYNNMLSVIIGFSQLAIARTEPGDQMHDDLREILDAAMRSADITRQLLAFARKQNREPKVLDLNDTVEGLLKMLRRLIGEDIDLGWEPGAGLWPVKMDPSQLNQILANLCVNSRDAISDIGRITIETDNVRFDEAYCADHPGFTPGEYVCLAVSDDGRGMDRETLDQVFEPFFTTKKAGKGTGLGLSTVYGIVKQNNGFINVYSEPGEGTTFRTYLARESREPGPAEPAIFDEDPAGNGETILVVEDESSILKLAKRMLRELGYAVLTASGPKEALACSQKYPEKIHLLITDVVMPGMNGRELSQRLLRHYPALKVLFMSGYTAETIAHRGVLEEGVLFIQKPFTRSELALKVKKALQ